jgi:hypothetical protein
MKTVTLGILALATLAGCAVQRPVNVVYDKPGATAADVQRDQALCAGRSSAQQSRSKLFAAVTPDRDEYVRCMEGLGYRTEQASLRR